MNEPLDLPRSTRLPARDCPACGKLLDAAAHPTEDCTPKSGDLTMCIACGEFFTFSAELELLPLDGDVLAKIDLIEIQRLRRAWNRWRESAGQDGRH